MARRARQDKDELIARHAPANKRLSPSARESKLASRTVAGARSGGGIPITRLYAWIAWVFLVPACFITTLTLVDGVRDSIGRSFWLSPAFWFFALGCVLQGIAFLWLPRPMRVYVWAHEMTHALFVIACGGKVSDFHVSARGGHILTDKNNILIALSPYFIPLYSVMVILIGLLAGTVFDLTAWYPLPWQAGHGVRPLWGLFLLAGMTWGFHATFTVWMLCKDQPDLRINGRFFSLTLIYLGNAALLGTLLVLAAPELSAAELLRTWGRHALEAARAVNTAVAALAGLVR